MIRDRHLIGWLMIWACVCLLIGACNRRPEGVLSDSEMESLLTDMVIAEAYEQSSSSSSLPDSVRSRLTESVMMKHGVDQATLDSTYAWYGENLDDYYKLYDRVTRRLAKLRTKAGGKVSGSSIENDIWILPKHILFTQLSNSDGLVFHFPGDYMQKGESLEWRMRLSADSEAEVMLGVDYEDGATSLTSQTFRNDRRILLDLVTDTSKNVKRIFGTVRIPKKSLPIWIDSITMGRLPYDSLRYSRFRSQRFSLGPRKPKIEVPDTTANSLSSEAADSTKSTATINSAHARNSGTPVNTGNLGSPARPGITGSPKENINKKERKKSAGDLTGRKSREPLNTPQKQLTR